MDEKEATLNLVDVISARNLVNKINKGVVTKSEVIERLDEIGTSKALEKKEEVLKLLLDKEPEGWQPPIKSPVPPETPSIGTETREIPKPTTSERMDKTKESYMETFNSPKSNSTEVYFWGMPGSGKTCALGAILSCIEMEGKLQKQSEVRGLDYMNKLKNIFQKEVENALPGGTPDGCMKEMTIQVTDLEGEEHNISLIDLPGEVIIAMYDKMCHQPCKSEDIEKTLERTCSYLKDKKNKKIHFFIVAYEELGYAKGLMAKDYLDNMANYLRDNQLIQKGTNGVYILLTKCDYMENWKTLTPEERKSKAKEYIQKYLPSLYKGLERECKKVGVTGLDVLPFSIGEVFDGKCKYNEDTAKEVINKILNRSKVKSGILATIFNS